MDKRKKLAVIALGYANAGKSSTWYELFGRILRSGRKILKIHSREIGTFVKNSSFEETGKEINENVFLRNASFEEYGDEVEDYFDDDNLPLIVLCSVQYAEKGLQTINYFKGRGYFLYIQWLNPGYRDRSAVPHEDYLGFESAFSQNGEFHIVSGKEKSKRVSALKEFIFNWTT